MVTISDFEPENEVVIETVVGVVSGSSQLQKPYPTISISATIRIIISKSNHYSINKKQPTGYYDTDLNIKKIGQRCGRQS